MIVLFNPLSTTPGKQPLPLSVMALAAVLEDREPWTLVDGNLVADPASAIIERLLRVPRSELALLAVTVMPGPQVAQAVTVCRAVRAALAHVPIVWGGYFPTQHADIVLRAPYVDFVVRSQGEQALLQLVAALRTQGALDRVGGLSWKAGDHVIDNPIQPFAALDTLPDLPYHRVDMRKYLHDNYLGRRTIAYNSSFGCPFACSFCAVVAMSNRRWLAQSPARMERALRRLVSTYRVDAVQMHDMDFFISEARTAEFCGRIADLGIAWWGLGRVDTLMQYSDATWRLMARSGLKMVFSGAESGSDAALATMNKGGKSAAHLTLDLARRMREYGIVPEFSFVLGSPPDPEKDVATTFEFIRRLKRINPSAELVLYTYTPVPLEGSLYTEAKRSGFAFPDTLDEWTSPRWEQLSMRRGDNLPWMEGGVRRRVRDFERVINAFYPTITDTRLTGWRRAVLKTLGGWRYALKWYDAPYELRAIHWLMRYQRPETTGF
ncbi:MAG: B12-binding domain-containing radical SAM protein [Acidobacteria bacterium]|nr:B12-binding domain-containing radical SAM protein [Acidobacteriota bacterium]